VLQLCELNLQLTLVGSGTLSKNIKDQSGPSNDPTFKGGLKVALLRGG